MRPSALARSATASVGGIPREKSSALARPELHVVAELDELAADGLADDASPQNSDAHVSISSDVPKKSRGMEGCAHISSGSIHEKPDEGRRAGLRHRRMTAPRFASVVLDVDSTVSGIEGIDWLARRRGGEIATDIARLTADAMRGVIPLEEVYGRRLELIRPTRGEIDALSQAYISAIAPDCPATIGALRRAGVRLALVSGGIRQAILPLARQLGIDPSDLHAVDLEFDETGGYARFDASSPLTTTTGKGAVVMALALPRPILAVGDGHTDLAMRSAVDSFAAFTGFVSREAVVRGADRVISSFRELASAVLD